MVKNLSGGNKTKGNARKSLIKKDSGLRVSQDECEIYAQAVKVLGGRIVSVIDLQGNILRGHIRGKFSGRGKRDNFISPGTWLLVGLHSWESDKSDDIKNCDILEVYNETDKNRLKNSVTTVNWSKFISNDSKTFASEDIENNDKSDIVFADESTQEYEDLIAAQITEASKIIMNDDGEEIDVDDI